jgi:outer membrane immunogenic protein
MNKLLIATLSIGALSLGAANAADLRAPVKAPVAVAPACAQFGGLYIGGHGGYGYYGYKYADKDFMAQTIDDDLPRSASLSDGNWHGGVQAGWNWQRNCTVFGIEADWAWSGMKASENYTDGDGPGAIDELHVQSKMRWFGTVRARTGIVVDNLLLYVTGGLAYAQFKRSHTIVETGPPLVSATFSSSDTRWGWAAGFGTEWAWSGNWSIKSEVLYMRFVEKDTSHTGVTINAVNFGTPGQSYRFGHQDEAWVTRIGLNYRFGGRL